MRYIFVIANATTGEIKACWQASHLPEGITETNPPILFDSMIGLISRQITDQNNISKIEADAANAGKDISSYIVENLKLDITNNILIPKV
jgi:hypothetical protein